MKKGLNSEITLFSIGGIGYGMIELLWRKHTHWSMLLTGGVCFTSLYHIFTRMTEATALKKCLVGGSVITGIEFCVGYAVNIKGKLKVWDYSEIPGNLMGQICIPYSLLWTALSLPVSGLCSLINNVSDN